VVSSFQVFWLKCMFSHLSYACYVWLFVIHRDFTKLVLKVSSNDKVQILTQKVPNSWMTNQSKWQFTCCKRNETDIKGVPPISQRRTSHKLHPEKAAAFKQLYHEDTISWVCSVLLLHSQEGESTGKAMWMTSTSEVSLWAVHITS
jgi:hypothetical protein